MNNLKIIHGPPGTGKSTRLIDIMEMEMAHCHPEEIAYVSFTKKAASEAKTRIAKTFRLGAIDFPYVRTLHSIAYLSLGARKSDVMSKENWAELGNYLGMTFSGDNDFLEEGLPPAKHLGNRYAFIDGFARARRITPEHAWRMLGDYDIDWHEFKRFQITLKEYKRERNLIDFSDMLEHIHEPLPVKVVIIDEAQDLSTLQWLFVSQIFANTEKFYIAGDDDQSIYQWSGADVRAFLNLPGETEVLRQSYRIPKEIHALANEVSSRIETRAEKEYLPADHEGSINYHRYLDTVDLSEGSWLLLARNSYMLHRLAKQARDQGMFFLYKGASSVNQQHLRAITLWERQRKGELIEVADRLFLDLYLPKELRGLPELPNRIWHEVLVKIPLEEREFYISMLRRGEKITTTPRVTISTIHGVKGGEADNVLLLTDVTQKTYEGFKVTPDAEHRVWYVGVTRAKKNLHIVLPNTKLFYQF